MISFPVVLALCVGCAVAGLLLGLVVVVWRSPAPSPAAAVDDAAVDDDSEAPTATLTAPIPIDRGSLTPPPLAPAPGPWRGSGAAPVRQGSTPVRWMEF